MHAAVSRLSRDPEHAVILPNAHAPTLRAALLAITR